MKIANGEMETAMETEELNVEVSGLIFSMKFLVFTEQGDHEVLLGLDWLQRTGAVLDV